MSALCREFDISRKSGYKMWHRYKALGSLGLQDRSRAPQRRPHRTSDEIRKLIVALRREYAGMGARKLRRLLQNRQVQPPAISTIHEILRQAGAVEPRRRKPRVPASTGRFATARAPNDRWTIDYKGQFRLTNERYCYPLTILDDLTRYGIACQSLESTRTEGAMEGLAEAFLRYGLPRVIRSDNGAPFAGRGLFGLSRLSVWLLKLGCQIERIDPGKPAQNGRHERFHLTLKRDTIRPAASNHLAQQERFDRFLAFYNHERPHEGLDDETPSARYESGPAWNGRTPEPDYPLHDDVRRVERAGHLTVHRKRIFLSSTLGGELVGLRELQHGAVLVSFAALDLGHWCLSSNTFSPLTPRRADFSASSKETGMT